MRKDDIGHVNYMKGFIIPLLVAVCASAILAVGASQLSLVSIDERVKALTDTVTALTVITEAVQTNQLQLAERGQWIATTDERIDRLEKELVELEKRQWTREDALRENELLRLEIRNSLLLKVLNRNPNASIIEEE